MNNWSVFAATSSVVFSSLDLSDCNRKGELANTSGPNLYRDPLNVWKVPWRVIDGHAKVTDWHVHPTRAHVDQYISVVLIGLFQDI